METSEEQKDTQVADPDPVPVTVAEPEKKTEFKRRDFAPEYSAKILTENESVHRAKFPPIKAEPIHPALEKIDYLKDVDLEASVELGGAVMTVEKILGLDVGSVIELNQSVTDPVKVLINGNPYALGEVVVIGEKFGVRITKIIHEP
jgi:flagellar motor switch protein FliN/FliY